MELTTLELLRDEIDGAEKGRGAEMGRGWRPSSRVRHHSGHGRPLLPSEINAGSEDDGIGRG